jgi:hypothetical protein
MYAAGESLIVVSSLAALVAYYTDFAVWRRLWRG